MSTSRGSTRRLRGALVAILACVAGSIAAYDNGSYDPVARAQALWKAGAGLHLEGDYEGAIALYHLALAHHRTARVHTYLAWSLSRLQRFEEAADQCRIAISLDPVYPNAYNDLGAYLIEMGRHREAVPWLRRAVGMPGYCCAHYAWYQLGRVFLLQARVEEARDAFRTALALRPMYRPARRLLEGIQIRKLRGL